MNRSSRAVIALLVLWLLLLPNVASQANRNNPFIWQVVVQYELGKSNQSATYLTDTSVKQYSQDFQTVFLYDDLYGHNERLLLDFGDGCPGTSMDNVQALNGNTSTSPSMMAQPSIALIQRGGRCTLWSDKVNQIQALSNQYHLNVGAIIVFDNATWPSVELITESTDNSSYPTWDASLPTTRNINNMSDNDIANHSNGIFLAIFFVPNVYGNTLKDLIHNYTLTSSGKPTQQYVQIAMFFSESTFSLDQDDNNAGGSGNADGNYWDVFTGDHAYIAYLLAAGGALVVALFFFRWCRTSRTGFGSRNDGSMDDEQAIGSGNIPLTESTHKMSLQKLDELCPVQEYRDAQETKNTICAICLEELNLHDMIRVLPCHHGFCVGCIDVWLTKKASICPICKYDCDHVQQTPPSQTDSSSTNAPTITTPPPTHPPNH
ncbi:hypothetical protein O0I10_002204 [Lichtheimia ornata]|uniref:RING-type domain-containing protein n=1 Tax=Lichtheimia ornata TaxID=688661 RepID=A0AAD7VB23_9FUNG|nr:uncharacterized protein O0I10_002204 [Lichtheimia ornata]KAJ8661873.1 hypothetical protein O0I10_002204 [Lichtheimia ornata]